jgi:outer membrane protein TolC
MLEQAYSNLKNNQVIQVGIKIPILDWGKGRGKVKMAQSNYEVVESRIKQETMNFNQNIFILVEQFNNQKAQLENAGTANRIAQKRYDTNIETFLIGRISTLDLNDSQSKKDYAKQNYINELFYYWYYYYQIRSLTLYNWIDNTDITENFESYIR